MSAITESTIVSDVVLGHAETLEVFESHEIDYRCEGGATIGARGCPTYRALFARLRELEADIHRHVHLENSVLMPRFATRPTSTGHARATARG